MSNTLKTLMLIAGLCITSLARSQSVYITKWKDEATKKVFITDNPGDADVIVYKSDWKSDAKKGSGIWYFTEWKNDADMLVYFTDFKSEADMVIYYTDTKTDAIWRNK